MKYLLDTHTLIWTVCNPAKLSAPVREIVLDTGQEVLVSVVSFWEISLKYSLGKLRLEGLVPEDFVQAATDTGFQIAALNADTTASLYRLTAQYHRDPFDRMLIWQAISQSYTLVSKDEQVHKYQNEGLKIIW